MDLLEHQGKQLLADAGLRTPRGSVVRESGRARAVAEDLGGRVVLKSQVPAGKRGKSGGIAFADDAREAAEAAGALLGAEIAGFTVGELLVEQAVEIDRELYLAVLDDPGSKSPLVLFSTAGGMDIEEVNAATPEKVRRMTVDIRTGPASAEIDKLVAGTGLPSSMEAHLGELIADLYRLYVDLDATLVEINPLVITRDADLVALDSKVSLDPGALSRHANLVDRFGAAGPSSGTELEQRARELGLQYIELDGDVGVLANGAGLTMTTLDTVYHYGGRPANFLEIGGDAYTKAVPAMRLVLDTPNVRSLLVNFCGAFARTDVMTGGVVEAIEELRPEIPVFFSVHGTGEAEAVALLRERLGVQPYDSMDDAVVAAVAAAREKVAY